jgi:aspartate/methionine/tyrosine aminotransferase|tara:strand:- start:259 stop:1407 length:1149 start_codon:yes stop_codon:yes gene_type:complete
MARLPDFQLETYFSRWEFNTKYNMCASDVESVSLRELLLLSSKEDIELWNSLGLGYTETFGSLKIREAIANTYDNISASDIITFAGAEEGIYVTMNCILNKNDHAIVITPNYQSSETLPRSICEVTGIGLDPNNNWNLDIQKIIDSIKPNTRLISINFPHNPTGKIISMDTFYDLISLARKKNIYIFNDEIYRLMERDVSKRLVQVSDIYEKGVSLNAMSKSYGMPGLRIGWVATKDHDLLDKMEKMKHYLSICNSAPSEILAIIALNSRKKILDRTYKIITKNLKILNKFFLEYEHLFDWKEPDGGCIGYPKYKGADGIDVFCEKLIKGESVLLLPSSVYISNILQSPKNHFRIGYGRENMSDALELVKNFINKNYSKLRV